MSIATLALQRGSIDLPLRSYNHTVAPGAGVTLANNGGGPAGLYLVEVWAGYSQGAPAAAEVGNIEVSLGGGLLATLPMQAVIGLFYFSFLARLNGSQTLFTRTVGAGTAGVGYHSAIAATRVGL